MQLVMESTRADYVRRRRSAFAARCRAGGLAVTPQRIAIIDALLTATAHPCADEVYAAVRLQHPHISRATVHRTLETFCRIGEARKVTMLHDSARFDANLTPHQHVVCVTCRAVRDIEFPELTQLLTGKSSVEGFETLGWSLEIQARCARCAQAAQNNLEQSQAPHEGADEPRNGN